MGEGRVTRRFSGGCLRLASMLVVLAGVTAGAGPARAASWAETLKAARGEHVYWYAWAGDPKINAYIDWVAAQVKDRFDIALQQVKIADTADAVGLVLAEKTAGRTTGGKADLVWLNGANFAAMKQARLLYGPFTQDLPNFALVDTKGKPTTLNDFTVPTDGYESPWGMAQLVFYADGARVKALPHTIEALGRWIADHPGRFTYPAPPDFTGATFLKQVLVSLTPAADRPALERPATDADFARLTRPLWQWLDAARPHLWHGGRSYPANYPALRQLVEDDETDIGFAFNPSEAATSIAQGLLPPTVRSFVLDGGTIGNTHFVAVPYDSGNTAAAMVVANFLLSPQAQARKADPRLWGDPTVLDVARLDAAGRAAFAALPTSPAELPPEALGPVLPEPHPSWMTRVAAEWQKRYAR